MEDRVVLGHPEDSPGKSDLRLYDIDITKKIKLETVWCQEQPNQEQCSLSDPSLRTLHHSCWPTQPHPPSESPEYLFKI